MFSLFNESSHKFIRDNTRTHQNKNTTGRYIKSIKQQGNKERLYNFYTGSGKAKSGIPLPGLERRLRPQNIVQSDKGCSTWC